MINLNFLNKTPVKISEKIFLKRLKAAEKLFNRNGELGLTIVDKAEIKKLNKKYRKVDKPTDVLSFPYEEVLLGDIMICPQVAKSQAKDKKHSFEKELAILFVHGLLHVFGYEHENDKEENIMEGLAKRILET